MTTAILDEAERVIQLHHCYSAVRAFLFNYWTFLAAVTAAGYLAGHLFIWCEHRWPNTAPRGIPLSHIFSDEPEAEPETLICRAEHR